VTVHVTIVLMFACYSLATLAFTFLLCHHYEHNNIINPSPSYRCCGGTIVT